MRLGCVCWQYLERMETRLKIEKKVDSFDFVEYEVGCLCL
jgi:hypothetical protein